MYLALVSAALSLQAPSSGEISCGAYCLSIASRLLGRQISNEAVQATSDPSGVSSFASLKQCARANGLFAYAVQMTPSQLRRFDGVAILQVLQRQEPQGDWAEHFTVFAGVGRSPGTYVILDPVTRFGRGEVPEKLVAGKWTGAALLITRAPLRVDHIAGNPRQRWGDRGVAVAVGVFGGLLCSRALWRRSAVRVHCVA
jgi:ABC-type bacteriocin/lantibiotic exporter with double-glycine peptidase domain